MKRIFCVLIALVLTVGMFAVTATAAAEDVGQGTESERVVTFHFDKFKEYVLDPTHPYYVEMNSKFMLDNKWWEDSDKVHEIFEGINYRVQPAEKEDLPDDEADSPDAHTVTYAEYDSEKTATPTPQAVKHLETKHFALPSAPIAKTSEPAEGEAGTPVAYFAGWEITAANGDDLPVWLQGTFAPGANIAMPAFDITVTGVWKDTEEEAESAVLPDDVIYMLYVNPNGVPNSDMKDWLRCKVTSNFNLSAEGGWHFRFAVVDGAKESQSNYTFKFDDVLTTTYAEVEKLLEQADTEGRTVSDEEAKAVNGTIIYYVEDTTPPKVKLSDAQKNKVADGLTVGTAYTVSTSLTITDCSSYTVTYIVYKKVADNTEGAVDGWLQIYDSKSREVTEGYENNITSGGVITPLAEDVTGEAVYKIYYTVVDNVSGKVAVEDAPEGTESTEEYHPTMLLKVNPDPTAPQGPTGVQIWQIILYVIAGLSAVAIVVLLCIKPKQTVSDARYNASAETASEQPAAEEETSSDEDNTENKE